MEYAKKLLEELGIDPGRVDMFNMSASEGLKFAQVVDEMTERIKGLGPALVGTEGALSTS